MDVKLTLLGRARVRTAAGRIRQKDEGPQHLLLLNPLVVEIFSNIVVTIRVQFCLQWTMAQPAFWSTTNSFFPIGRKTPVSLTESLPPERDARVLLLGCGDPGNILFTLHADNVDTEIGESHVCHTRS